MHHSCAYPSKHTIILLSTKNRITVIHSTLCTTSTYVPLSTTQVTSITCLRTPSFLESMFGQILVVISRLPKKIPFLGGRPGTMMREPVFEAFPWTKVSGKSCWRRRKQVTRQRRVMDSTSGLLRVFQYGSGFGLLSLATPDRFKIIGDF